MSECIFCKILKGELPCHKVYEDDKVLAFLDIHPATRGHTLVVWKEHKTCIEELNEEDFLEFTKKLYNIAKKIGKYSEGYNILMNDNKAAGQLVPHLHFHIIPRKEGDGVKVGDWDPLEIQDIEKIQEDIKKLLK
jgi:histidine triad (HIT) family protein